MLRTSAWPFVVALALVCTPAWSAPAPAPSAEAAALVAELEANVARLADASPQVRVAAAESLAQSSVELFPAIEARLARAPEAGPGPMWLVLDKLKKAGDAEGSLPLKAVALAGGTAAHRSLALLLAGIQASERQGGLAGARVLVRLSVDHKGLLKPWSTAALKRLGDRAVAALIEVRRDADKDVRGFANKHLDAMGKFLPSDAVQVHDPQALADVLTAFGRIKDPDAMRAVVPYLNAERAPVREAARWAIAQYGPDARPILEETYEQFSSEKVSKDWTADKILAALVVAYDKVRLAEVFKLLDEGVAHRDAGRLEEAITSFDALLARAPQFERRAELAPAYHELARKKDPTDRAGARTLYAKAHRLASGTPLSSAIEADLAVLETRELLERGIADTALLQKALALDPGHGAARALLQRIDDDARVRDDKLRRFALAGFAGLVAMLLAVLLLGRTPAKPRPGPRRPVRI